MSDQVNAIEEEISDDPILGKVVKNYPSDRLRMLIIGGVLYGVASVILNIVFLPVEAETASIFVIGGMSLFSLILGWFILHFWNREVVVYENGFSYLQGSHTYYYLFKDIVATHYHGETISFFGGLIKRTIKRFTLITNEDETIVLDQVYKHLDDLVLRLEAQINAHLRESIRDRISNGYEVPFGDALKISSGGIVLDGKTLAWDEFQGYKISSGRLTFASQNDGTWGSITIADLQNATLLVEFLKERKQG